MILRLSLPSLTIFYIFEMKSAVSSVTAEFISKLSIQKNIKTGMEFEMKS